MHDHTNLTSMEKDLTFKTKRLSMLLQRTETGRIKGADESQKCVSFDSDFNSIHITALCLLCFSGRVKLGLNRRLLSRFQVFL